MASAQNTGTMTPCSLQRSDARERMGSVMLVAQVLAWLATRQAVRRKQVKRRSARPTTVTWAGGMTRLSSHHWLHMEWMASKHQSGIQGQLLLLPPEEGSDELSLVQVPSTCAGCQEDQGSKEGEEEEGSL